MGTISKKVKSFREYTKTPPLASSCIHLDEHTLGHTHTYASYTNPTMLSKIELERKFSIVRTKLIISDIFMTN